jgi:hypothetical protein
MYNLEKLIRVKVRDAEEAYWYTHKKEVKFLGIILRKEGIYNAFGNRVKECPETHFIKDDIVYEKPRVRLTFVNDYVKEYHFDTFEEAKAYRDRITYNGHWTD